MSDNSVFPGDKIASIEEYEAGHNTFDDGDMVRSSTMGEKNMDFPFWYGLNGPLSDAIYHIGQVTNLRRASGNPIDQEINVFFGKKMPHLSNNE